jgi:hypothetical protein
MKTDQETKPGVFITPITKQRYYERIEALKGEDRHFFISECNRFKDYSSVFIEITGRNKADLLELCRNIEPNFNPETDFFAVRYLPNR